MRGEARRGPLSPCRSEIRASHCDYIASARHLLALSRTPHLYHTCTLATTNPNNNIDANTLSFGLSCVGGVPSAQNMNESEEDFILSNAEVYALLSKDATVRSEDQLSDVFKSVHKYTKR